MWPIVMPQALLAIKNTAFLSPAKGEGSCLTQMAPHPVSNSTSMAIAPSQDPVTMLTIAPSVPPPSTGLPSALAAEWWKLPTPYRAEGFRKALHTTALTSRYPSLVHDIKFESPIGALATLAHTTIMPNLLSARLQLDIVSDYTSKEVALGCMAGLFTLEETHHVFNGNS